MNIYIVERWYTGFPNNVEVVDVYANKEEAKSFLVNRMQSNNRKFDYGVRKKTLIGSTTYKIKTELSLIDYKQKMVLEEYLPLTSFNQRKTYSEWYVKHKEVEREINMDDIELLGKHFNVEVLNGYVYLKDKQ